MKSNVEILDGYGMLTDIRERLGAKDGTDECMDDIINGMDAMQLVASWTGWNLGDEGWARTIISKYTNLIKDGVKKPA